jgi:hypothetical protein
MLAHSNRDLRTVSDLNKPDTRGAGPPTACIAVASPLPPPGTPLSREKPARSFAAHIAAGYGRGLVSSPICCGVGDFRVVSMTDWRGL